MIKDEQSVEISAENKKLNEFFEQEDNKDEIYNKILDNKKKYYENKKIINKKILLDKSRGL